MLVHQPTLFLRTIIFTGLLSAKTSIALEINQIYDSQVAKVLRVFHAGNDASNIHLLTDGVTRENLVYTVQSSLFRDATPLKIYNISSQRKIQKYCNDTTKMTEIPEIMTFVFSTRHGVIKLLQQLQDECKLAWRRVLLVVLWRGRGGVTSLTRQLTHDAIRLTVLHVNASSHRVVVYSNQVSGLSPRSLFPVNIWSEERGMLNFPILPPRDDVFRDLGGRILKVPVLHKPPWYFVEKHNNTLMVIGGRDHQLLVELATRMNFRFVYLDPPEHNQGSAEAVNVTTGGNVNWRGGGVLNLLSQRKVDLFLGDAAVTYERSLDLDFSFFTLADSGAFITRAPSPLSEALALVRPFHWQVWVAVIIAALISGPSLYLVTTIRAGTRSFDQNLGDCIWSSIAIFLKQSIRVKSRSHKTRLLIVLFSVCATYVIGDTYCAYLTSLLTSPGHERPVRTLAELERAVSARRYELLVERRSSALDFLRDGTNEARRLWRLMQRQPRSLVTSVERGVSLVRARRGLALFAGRETLKFETIRFGEQHFHVSDPLYTRYSAVALQHGCPYLIVLDSIVSRLFEAGVLDRMTALEYTRLDYEATSNLAETEDNFQEQLGISAKPMSLKMLQGAFIILLAGHITAGITLFIEIFVSRRQQVLVQRPKGARDYWFSTRNWRRRMFRLKRSFKYIISQTVDEILPKENK